MLVSLSPCRTAHGNKAAVVEQDEAAVADLEVIGTVVAVLDAGWVCGLGFPPIIMSTSM